MRSEGGRSDGSEAMCVCGEGGQGGSDRKLMMKPASLSYPHLPFPPAPKPHCFVCFPLFFSSPLFPFLPPPSLPPSTSLRPLIAFLSDPPLADQESVLISSTLGLF